MNSRNRYDEDDADSDPKCREKLTFDNRNQAEGGKVYVKQLHAGANPRVYQCRNCGLYHLTSS